MLMPPFLLQPRTLLAFILLLALALRLYGIEAGLPNAANPVASYHPDETPTLLQAHWLSDDFYRPQQFIYGGTLYYSLVGAFLKMGDLLTPVLNQYNLEANTLLVARNVMVYIALITLLLVYESVRTLHGEKKALLAAFILAVMPAHVVTSQQMRPEAIGAFLVALQYLFAVKILSAGSEASARRILLLAAVLAGVMLAFRFPLVLFFAMPMLAWLLRAEAGLFWQQSVRRLLPATLPICIALMTIAYAACSPATFTQFPVFMAGMELQWEFQSNPFVDAVGMGPIPWQYWWSMLHQALGYPFYFVTLAGIVILLRRRNSTDWLLLAGLVPYMVMVSMTTWVVVRYTLPLLPLLAVVAADTVQVALQRFNVRIVQSVTAAASALTLWAMLAFLHMEASVNVRDLTKQWVEANVPAAQCMLAVKAYNVEEFYNPHFDRRCIGTSRLDEDGIDYRKMFAEQPIAYVLIHQHMYASMERLGKDHPGQQHRDFFAAMVNGGFTLLHEEKVEPVLWGVNFASWFTSMDMTYVNPGFRIYQRTGTPTPTR